MLDVMQLYGAWDNYIAALRKQWGLSQADLALLLDVGQHIIRDHEKGKAEPTLRGLLALELIFEAPVFEIFAGTADATRNVVAARAWSLLESMSDKPTAENQQLLRTLERVAHVNDPEFRWKDIR